jgi:ElaB/YqjD/DUF883 family membrane-anchored ribosome-binding protein
MAGKVLFESMKEFYMSTSTISPPDGKASRFAGQVDEFAHDAADRLHGAASSVRESGRQGSKAIEDLAESTAGKLDGAGSFVDRHDAKHALAESRQFVRQHAGESMVLAAAVGFLAGFAARRFTHACDRSAVRGCGD